MKDIGEPHVGDKNEPRIYGGAQIGTNAKMVLTKDPNYMILDRIDLTEIEVEIEKGLAKARYEMMNSSSDEEEEEIEDSLEGNDSNLDTERDNDGKRDRQQEEIPDKTINYANMRATEIPTVQRLYPPKPGTVKKETIMENIKMKMMDTAIEYKRKHCDKKGRFKNQNLNSHELEGVKEIKENIKEGNIVVFSTDKSGRFSVDTPSNYEDAITQHTRNDQEIDGDRVKQIENHVNLHMRQLNRIFKVGAAVGHEERVTGATMSTNIPPPPLYGLRKDHKSTADEKKGPPVRPVCGANQAPNSRLSHFLIKIINDYADSVNIQTECRSSEEMRASFEQYNELDPNTRKQCCIISMDVKALYPSMEWKEIITSVREMIESSEIEEENINWTELGKYLAVTMSKDEITDEGLRHVIPRRKEETNRNITVSYLNDKKMITNG